MATPRNRRLVTEISHPIHLVARECLHATPLRPTRRSITVSYGLWRDRALYEQHPRSMVLYVQWRDHVCNILSCMLYLTAVVPGFHTPDGVTVFATFDYLRMHGHLPGRVSIRPMA